MLKLLFKEIVIWLQGFNIQTFFPDWDFWATIFPQTICFMKHVDVWLYVVLLQEGLSAWNNLDFSAMQRESLYTEADWDIAALWRTVCLPCRILVKRAPGTRGTRVIRQKKYEVFWAILSSTQRVCPAILLLLFPVTKTTVSLGWLPSSKVTTRLYI